MINGKKIGIDARMIEMSGIGTYIQHLMGQGIYDVAVGNEDEIRRYDKEVKVIPFDTPIYGLKEQLQFPCKSVRNAGVNIMHFPHYNVPVTYHGAYVTTVHDLTHIVLPEFLGSGIKYYYAKFLMSQALKRAKHVFTVSENSKKDIVDYFGIQKDMISITYDAIDEEFRVKDRTEIDYLYEKYKIARDKKILLYVGNLKPHKNLITLLKALKIMNREDVLLLLVGKAFKSVDLERQEEELGIKEHVIHTGMVDKNELIDIYNLADIFVFPSLYEGFGIPPLEAMACGTPVIAANNSSIPEVCGNAAMYFDGRDENALSEKIVQLINNRDKQNNLESKGKIRSEQFNWKQAKTEVGGGTGSAYEKPIKVLHYIKHLETGGGESLVFNLYQHIDRDKVQFDFAVNTAEEERLDKHIKEMGGRIYPICDREPGITPLKLWKTTKGLKRLLKDYHYDIVHIHCSNGQGLYYSNVARQCGVRNVICHVHNTSVVGRFKVIKTAVHNYFRKKYMDAPTEYMACSMDAAKWLYSDNVIAGNSFQILKNGIDVDKFCYSESDRWEIRKKLGFQDKKVLCTIGRCVKEKNQIFILRVLEQLLKVDDNYRLILIGQGLLEGELKDYSHSHGMDEYIAFIKSTDVVEKYMSASDYFLLASTSSEGLGIVAIESQASGLRTMISDNVPDDVLISPFCEKIDLADGIGIWANAVNDHEVVNRRETAGEYVRSAGYEIQKVSNDIQGIYETKILTQ